jgi:hypothetical protein
MSNINLDKLSNKKVAEAFRQLKIQYREQRTHELGWRIFQAHLREPRYRTTWENLANNMGFDDSCIIHLHYGRFAHALWEQMGYAGKPHDPRATRDFWLSLLVDWADDEDPYDGYTVFVLRPPIIRAVKRLRS